MRMDTHVANLDLLHRAVIAKHLIVYLARSTPTLLVLLLTVPTLGELCFVRFSHLLHYVYTGFLMKIEERSIDLGIYLTVGLSLFSKRVAL
jgi:hypothetical protein